jgi:hypothetical protein
MKNLLTLAFIFSIFSASAQLSASLQKTKNNDNICLERGHSIKYTTSTVFRPPYTIDTKDSTVTVYPVPNSTTGKCSRCGAEIESYDKDIRITTWRRSDKTIETVSNKTNDPINWGNNQRRSLNESIQSGSLDDVKKVATLRNDTLFIHKRIDPFASLKEQVTANTTIYYKNNPISFKTAVFDEAVFFTGKNGIEIY